MHQCREFMSIASLLALIFATLWASANPAHISCWESKLYPSKLEYVLKNVSIHHRQDSETSFHFIFKFQSRATGKPFTLKSQGIFHRKGDSLSARLEISQPLFSHIEFELMEGSVSGAYGTLWSQATGQVVGGGLLQCRDYSAVERP